MDILDNYFLFVKITDLLTEEQKYNIIPIICKYITIFHNIHEDEIELALFSNNICSIINKLGPDIELLINCCIVVVRAGNGGNNLHGGHLCFLNITIGIPRITHCALKPLILVVL